MKYINLKKKKSHKKAFALLISLFLMAFIVLLVLTLSAIVQAELRIAKQVVRDQQAKNAAKLAAFQALSEIQKSLGADQRISANASILDNEINDIFEYIQEDESYAFWAYDFEFIRDEVESIDNISHPHWLGVWDSTPGLHPVARSYEESKAEHSERILAYANNFLVSGNVSIYRDSVFVEDELSLAYSPVDELSVDYINMLRKNSIADENNEYDSDIMSVKVPLVTLAKTSSMEKRSFLETRIAWWVSDESQKAPLTIASEDEFTIASEDANEQIIQALPYKNGMQALSLSDSESPIFDVDLNNSDDREYLRSINDLSQLDLLKYSNITASPSKMFYNSIASYSRGLAVNVREGGLKKDLSVGLLSLSPETLEYSPNYFNRPMGVEGFDSYFHNKEGKYNTVSNSLYTDGKGHMFGPQVAGNMNLSFIEGINYTLNDPTSTITQEIHKDPGGPVWDSLREYYNNRVTKEGVDVYNATSGYANKVKVKTDLTTGLSPVLQNYQLFIYPCITSYGGGDYGVRIYMVPIVVLWNPYDIDIAAGSTFAFRHGNGGLNTIGNFRIAIGIKDTSDTCFKCLRDIRSEKIPRPIKNTDYTASLASGGVELNEGDKDINFYRAVSFSDEEDSRFISASDDGVGTSKINKSFFGYGNWTEYHAEELVDVVENNTYNPYFPKLVDFDSVSSAYTVPSALTKGGLIRIYEKGDVETVQGVSMPTYYKLSQDSFYYRKLYLNNLRYSLAWTGQVSLSVGGGISALSESNLLDLMKNKKDQSLRFLVRNEQVLKGGEARVFTLKSSVPYHYKWNNAEGYAGNFGKAVTNGWYLTEGVEKDSIGGFFVDIMHPESAHTASTNDLGTAGTPDYDYDTYKGQVFDPQNTDTHDGKAIAVLFNLNEEDRQIVYDDRDHSESVTGEATKLTLSIDDICLDFGNMNQYSTTSADTRFMTGPIGYIRPDASFCRNPFIQTTYSTSSLVAEKSGGSSLVYDEIVMWNYDDDNDEQERLLYQQEEPAEEVESGDEELIEEELESNNTFIVDVSADGTGYIATGSTMEFQSLKRYSLQRTEGSFHLYGSGTSSFPDAWNTEGSDTYSYFSAPAGYDCLRTTLAGTDATGGKALYLNESPSYIFTGVSTTVDGEEAYGISLYYSLDRPLEAFIKMTNKRRSVLRVIAPPVASSYCDETLYDVYYKNLMQEINYRIILANVDGTTSFTENGKVISVIYNGVNYTSYASLYTALNRNGALPSKLYTDDDYEDFLTDIGLDSTYRDSSWGWEDPYFLLRDARRISVPMWLSYPWETYSDPSSIEQDDRQAWRDQVPLAFNAQVVVDGADNRGLSLTELMAKDADGNVALVMTEGINAYRPVNKEIDIDGEWQFQYPFKFPWITQTTVSAKNFGDGRFGNAGNLRDRSYGTDTTRGVHLNSPQAFACWFARGDNLTTHTFFGSGTAGYQGNSLMTNLLDYYVNYEINSKHVQIGPDVMSDEGYSYSLSHFLRDYETVTSPADLSTANLVFGADQSRNRGVGVGTADILYPNYTMGSSYANMKIAPERNYEYDWIDSYSFLATNSYISLYGGYSAERDDKEIRRIRYDMAWMLNDLLWDEYFFSTVAYRDGEQNLIDTSVGYLMPKNPRVEYINNIKDKVYSRTSIDSEIISLNNIVVDTNNLDYDFESNASRFWIKGVFNVNSTNVDAWKMVLGTSFGNKIYALDSTESEASDLAPFPRNGLPYTAKEFRESTVRGNEEEAMQAYRALNRAELEELALSVVENVKDRGPFFSLADFVNRTVELRSMETRRMATEYGYNAYDFSNEIWEDAEADFEDVKANADEEIPEEFYLMQNHMQKGVLQSAIDLTIINDAFFDTAYLIDYDDELAGLNARFATMNTAPDKAYAILTKVKPSRYYTPEYQYAFWEKFGNPRNIWENYKATLGSTLAGAPAYLTQVDILKQIGSFITVRGDTFKIRAYGEVRNPLTEEVESKAWCEMLVQRYPEYINASSNAPTDINNREKELGYQSGRAEYDSLVEHLESNPVNKYLGRRFKVMSFKWLSEREI